MQEFISKMTFFWETMLRWYCLWYKMYLSLVPSPHMPPGARVGWGQVLVNEVRFLGVITQKW